MDLGSTLNEVAAGLRARAGLFRSLAGHGWDVIDRSGWTGGRADEVRDRASERARDLGGLADRYEALARQIEYMAGEYRHVLRAVRADEERVRAWLRSATPEQRIQLGGQGTLPPSGSPRWKLLAARVGETAAGP
jgi:hypothetical protein